MKSNATERVWKRWAPYWHVCSALIGGGVFLIVWFKDVTAAADEVKDIKSDVTEIKFNLKNIAGRLGVEYIKHGEE